MIAIAIPQQLRSYTDGLAQVDIEADSILGALDALDACYPGVKFRVIDEQGRLRPHMRMFVNNAPARDLRASLNAGDELYLFGALSGG